MWLEIVKLALPAWNERVHTEEDFDAFCAEEHLKVIEAETGEHGLYVVYNAQPFIVLDPNLKGEMRLWVKWHEAAHHLLHIPATEFFSSVGEDAKSQWQANVVASCLLIPQTLLRRMTIGEIREEFNYPKPLCYLRMSVFERLKL